MFEFALKCREPDFSNIAAVFEKRCPLRPTLYEFYFNDRIYGRFAKEYMTGDWLDDAFKMIKTFVALGYDYANVFAYPFMMRKYHQQTAQTISLNENAFIYDWKSFETYPWPDPATLDYIYLDKMQKILPEKMKLIVYSYDGILENTIGIVGYTNLCMMLYDDPQLAEAIFYKIGSLLWAYYKFALDHEAVGAVMCNDDWGFHSQTLLSPADLRKHVFPWYKKIVAYAHSKGKYAILHSCGRYEEIIGDIIDDMCFDGRHSYEDSIIPVEQAYDTLNGKIAVLGGLDINFMTKAEPCKVYERARNMLEKSREKGGYALGTGNSVPLYIPDENFFAMIKAALEN